jgi:hypothetical protein
MFFAWIYNLHNDRFFIGYHFVVTRYDINFSWSVKHGRYSATIPVEVKDASVGADGIGSRNEEVCIKVPDVYFP